MGITQSGVAAASAVSELVALVSVAGRAAKLDTCLGVRFLGALPRATAAGYGPADPVARSCFVALYLNRLAVLAPDGVRTDARGLVVGLGRAVL
jgi:hypothetical protein